MLLLRCKNRQQLVRNSVWLIIIGHFLIILILLSSFGSEFMTPVIIRVHGAAPVRFMAETKNSLVKKVLVQAPEIKKEEKSIKKSKNKKKIKTQKNKSSRVFHEKTQKTKQKLNQKKIEEKKPKKIKKVVEEKKIPEPQQEVIKQEITSQKVEKVQGAAITEPIYIGKETIEMLAIHKQIRDELQNHWHVPSGLSPETFCKLLVTLGRDGKVLAITIEESSNTMIYNTAARNAACKTVYPKEVWGKKLPLLFSLGS